MSDPLATYLHDHLAGSNFAVQLLESLHDQYSDQELRRFAAALLVDVRKDRETLQGIVDRIGSTHLDLKDAAAWLAEKASRMKLGRDHGAGLGTFEALETLSLGILGKLSLWRVLPVIAEVDPRLRGTDFEKLAARAQEQFDRVEVRRLEIARKAFAAARNEVGAKPPAV
jgi:hypothetical protein